jgi:hypothetical protein
LLGTAQKSGVKLREGGTRTDLLSDNDMANLGLTPLLERIHKLTDRKKTKLMIYKSVEAFNKRGVNIQFDLE